MGGSAVSDERGSSPPSGEIRTLVLVGKMGNGRSATGNSILGTKKFKSGSSSVALTRTCELQSTVLEDGTILNLIDTPCLLDAEDEFTGKEIAKCISMAKDGIHGVLLVLSVRIHFSQKERDAIQSLRKLFGSEIINYMIIVYNDGDELEEKGLTLNDYFANGCPEPLKETLEMCGNRCVVFDNRTRDEGKKYEQLKKLVSLVNDVVDKNGGKPYSNELFVEFTKELKSEESAQDELRRRAAASGCVIL